MERRLLVTSQDSQRVCNLLKKEINMYSINLNKDVFNGAARYAQKHNVSVESFIESLIINAVKEKPKFDYKSEENLSPLIKSLIGVLPQHNEADEFDYKKARMEYLTEKYGL